MNYVRIGGYIPPQPIEDYNDLPNIPVQNQDLAVSGFTPVANSYYRHTGATTASFTKGVIYLYNGTGYVALDGSAYGLATVAKTGSYNDLLDKPTIPTDYVPNTRKVNNKALSSDITLGASDVGALPTAGGTVTGNLTVGGNLTINGTTTTVDSTTLQVKDKLIEVAHGNTATLTTPAGLVAPKYDGTNSGALVFDSTGTAYVGDVTLKDGNIDVANSGLQPLATRTGLVGGNLVQYDSSALTLKDSGKKISDLALKTDLNSKANLSGGNTFNDLQTINAPTNVSGSEQTTMKVKTSNGGAIIFGKEGHNSGTMIRLDQVDGTCRLRFRSSKTAGAMVWEQPEQGAKLHVDLGKDGSDKHRVTFPSSAGTLALTKQIPTNYVTTDTTQNNISGRKTFTNTIVKKSNTIDLNNKPTSGTQWNYIEFTDKNDDRIGIAGSRFDAGGYAGVYLQARNSQQLWIASSTPDSNGNTVTKTSTPTPPATDDSTQIANTAWVRENYQATCYAGRDSGETGTMYFKVASYSTVADYDHVTLVAHLQDIDSPVFSTVNVHCSTSTKAHAPNAFIGVVDNFTHDASNNPFNYYKDRLFVVANYTIGTQGVTFELWLKTTDKYQQTIFKVISQSSRKGTSKKRPWTLYNNVTTASGTTDFSETSSDGRLVVNNNYLYGATVSYLQPQTNNNIDLGASGQRWRNGYITNLQLCKVINGGGGNSMIQQDSDTSGADITVGSTGCPLKIQGKNARPTYRQGKNGTYANLALQSDIPTFSLSGTTLTITL